MWEQGLRYLSCVVETSKQFVFAINFSFFTNVPNYESRCTKHVIEMIG